MYLFIAIFAAIFVILGIIVGAQNGSTLVSFHLLGKEFPQISLTLVIIESIVVGMAFAFIISVVSEIRLRGILRRRVREVKSLQDELGSLRKSAVEEEKEEKEEEK
jgi:uncharacterized membrane protein YciS (DUF1049 family)